MSRTDFLWLLLLGGLSSAYCVSSAAHLGPTFDEPFYVAKGMDYWHTGSHRALMRAGTMPIPVDVQTFPVVVWEHARGERFDAVSDLLQILPVARAANLLFWWVLLLYAVRLGNLWGGAGVGRWVAAVLACEPNLLAHASLATTDTALTAGFLAAVYHFAANPNRVLVPGVAAGLAVGCKASAVAFVPLAWAVLSLVPLSRGGRGVRGEGDGESKLPTSLAVGIRQAVVAALTLFMVCGTDWAVEPSFVKWADTLPTDTTGNATRFAAEHLRIFPNAAEGIVQQIKHNGRGHGCFVLGEWHDRAVWWYFPVVLSAKLPEPLLLLLAGLLVFRPKALLNAAGLIAVVLLLFSLSCRVQLGVRLVLPLVAMLNVAVVVAVCRGGSRKESATVGLLVMLSAFVTLSHWPHGLRYCNELWGGRAKAAEVLADSNHDWGQGLPELNKWWEERSGLPRVNDERAGVGALVIDSRQTVSTPLRLWYYGTDPACLLPPFELVQVNQMPNPCVDDVKRLTAGGYFAVGESFFSACPDRRPGTLAVLAWLRSQTPVAVVGTLRVYHIP